MTGLVGWWPLHENSGSTARDLSGEGNHGTLSGGVTQGVAGKGGLTAYSFDGSDDYVGFGSPSVLNFSGGFTVACWAKVLGSDSNGGDRAWLMDTWNWNSGGWYIEAPYGSGIAAFKISDSGGTNTGVNGGNINGTNWHNYLATFDGSIARLYIDGSEVASNTLSIGDYTSNQDNLTFGYQSQNGYYSNHIQTDSRVYNRALSASEVQALYDWGSGDYASPPNNSTDSSAVSRWSFDDSGSAGTLGDQWNGNSGSVSGASYVSDSVRGSAMSFDGSGDYVDLGNPGSLDFNSSSFTVSGWLKVNGSGSRNSVLVRSMDASTDGDGISYALYENNGDANLRLHDSSSNGNIVSASIQASKWNHIAGVRDAGNELRLFVNGVLQSSGGDINPRSSTETVRIGNNPDGDKWQLNGVVDELRVYSRALTASEIFQLYQWGTRGRNMRKITVNQR